MTPTNRLLALAAAWLLLAMGVVMVPVFAAFWWWIGLAGIVCVLFDAICVRCFSLIEVRRRLPGRFALGEYGEVRLTFRNPGKQAALIEVFDGIPPTAVTQELPWAGEVPAQREITVFYPLKLMERGECKFGAVHLRRVSPMGFWKRSFNQLSPESVKVYPNYEPVIRFALLA
ncbi:MAG: hypothetical protein H8M99_07095, partial [Gloeobacteraceae cyanobacterium ES-bin-144]|nr:hypothetical protein [Verrucomicrobiales bacterium]